MRRSLLKLLHRLHLAYQDFEVLWLFPELLRMNVVRVSGTDVLFFVETLFVLHESKLLSLPFSVISCWCSLGCDAILVGFFFDILIICADCWASLFVAITSVSSLRSILFDGFCTIVICSWFECYSSLGRFSVTLFFLSTPFRRISLMNICCLKLIWFYQIEMVALIINMHLN